MKNSTSALMVVVMVVVLVAADWCSGQVPSPSPSFEHLKFLDPMVGQWQVNTTGGGQKDCSGMESGEWILNKSFLKHDGWGLFDGKPVRYVFVTGWNAKTEKVFQWGAGGNAELYGFQQRIGSYDPAQKAYIAQAEGVLSGDVEHSNTVKLKVDENKVTIDFTAGRMNGEPVPDGRDEFSRKITVTAPKFDEAPGPAYEHLKPIEWLVGNWDLRGAWADGKPHEGGEQSEWAFNQNFIQGTGWWNDRDGKRNSYAYLIAWDSKAKKILMAICGDDGSHTVRLGMYSPETKTLTCHQDGVSGNGETTSADVQFHLTKEGTIEGIGTNIRASDKSLPDLKTTFSRK